MPYLNEHGLQTFWNNCKQKFANALGITPAANKVTLAIKDSTDTHETLGTVDINAATSSLAGVMSATDKDKLDGIAEGATANVGTITEITSTSPIVGSGSSGSVALSHANSGVTAGSKGLSNDLDLDFGDTFLVTSGTVNATGHVTDFNEYEVTLPSTEASTTDAGLMSASDKTKLNAIPAFPSPATPEAYLNATGTWQTPLYYTYSFTDAQIGSASAGTAISADDITNWSAGTAPALTVTPTTVITDISSTDGQAPSYTVSGGKLTLSAGTMTTVSSSSTSVGSASAWSAGTLPSLSYTSRSIPNISVTTQTVLTGSTQTEHGYKVN